MLDRSPKGSKMSDVTTAQTFLHEQWPEQAGRPVKSCIWEIFNALRRVERQLPSDAMRQRPRQWTERRVRSIWHGEARRLDHYEMTDLEIAASGEARNVFKQSIERAARMAAFLETADPDFHGSEVDRIREFLRGLAGPGVGGSGTAGGEG
jgi:hypothetical protein